VWRSLARSAVLVSVLSLGACGPTIQEGRFGCEDGACPSGWYCHADLRCWSAPELDAGPPDTGPSDAGMPDGGMPDGGMPDGGTPDAGCGTDDSSCMLGAGGMGICCDGRCIDPMGDPRHCGACATDCTTDTMHGSCAGGVCVACTSDGDCDDGIECTADSCTTDGSCTHTPDDGLCPGPTSAEWDCLGAGVCSPTTGCGFAMLPDLATCRNAANARWRCWRGVCNDLNGRCGGDFCCCSESAVHDLEMCVAAEWCDQTTECIPHC
jgi:hypothetical protein